MTNFKKEISGERIDKFFAKEFGKGSKRSNVSPSEMFKASNASVSERFAEISEKIYGKKLSSHEAELMVCRFEMPL